MLRLRGPLLAIAACGCAPPPHGPHGDARPIDRFSAKAGHLMVRDAHNGLPPADAPIDLDRPPFITQGLGPDGSVVRYYNFDVQPDQPATLYRLTRAGHREALAGQRDVVDSLPGDPGYSDFWRISWVEVPQTYVAGTITSAGQLAASGFTPSLDSIVIDCPIVPKGSTAREGNPAVRELAYRNAVVTCLQFSPGPTLDGDRIPTSPIYVTFGADPKAGFRTEASTPQTHNVVLSLPGDTEYSPLWAVHIYDRAAFPHVHDAGSALAAPLVEAHGPLVNCPIVAVTPR